MSSNTHTKNRRVITQAARDLGVKVVDWESGGKHGKLYLEAQDGTKITLCLHHGLRDNKLLRDWTQRDIRNALRKPA